MNDALMAHGVYFTDHGAGPPLLLIHGVMITGAMFEPVIAGLAAHYRVIVPDLRGHGRSAHLPPPYTPEQLATDLVRLLDRLEVESTAVLGYSQGGAIAQQLVLDYPARCKRLVLACTYAYNMTSLREKLEGYLAPALVRVLGMRAFARLVISQGLTQLDRQRAEWVIGLIGAQDRDLMIEAWKHAMAFDSRRRLAEIACPTLIVAGSSDHAVPLHHAEMLHKGIRGARMLVVDGADHALIWSHPARLIEATDAFLRQDAR